MAAPKGAAIIFDVSQKNPVIISDEIIGQKIDKEKLKNEISIAFKNSEKIEVEIPFILQTPEKTKQDLSKMISKRGGFFTNYEKSTSDRKYNINRALGNFNGMMIDVGQEVSFNKVTGNRDKENGYKMANIIFGGEYVQGIGGGVCQASTTLYNAMLCSGIDILEVHKHTLPSSYVWLGFDAMVNEGSSDLRFVNNTNYPIYIKTYHDDKNVYVDVYGEPLGNTKIVRRSETVEVIPHPGDKIVVDTEGKYYDKVTYKGEYMRLRYPKEGYRAKAYLDIYKDDVLVESRLLREETYSPQYGVIIEGTEEVTEGITLPPNSVKFIGPAK